MMELMVLPRGSKKRIWVVNILDYGSEAIHFFVGIRLPSLCVALAVEAPQSYPLHLLVDRFLGIVQWLVGGQDPNLLLYPQSLMRTPLADVRILSGTPA